ncbi:MAG: penicillin-binding protein 1C [Deltaproteobacteria bacterium]|nr:penicillin-binding protein 1C [Deltaproteobacteria bacterium]
MKIKSRPVYLFVLSVCFFILSFLAFPHFLKYDFSELKKSYEESYRIYDRKGVLLREVVNSEGFHAYWVDYPDIPTALIKAVIATEDERFYKHKGVDYLALMRALFQNVTELEVQSGASTITMQLARLIGDYPRNIFGKMGQIFTARSLEAGLNKEEILTLYINMVPMGGGNIGMEAGAREYFGASLNLLSRSQIAFLTGLIQGPGVYSPYNNLDGAVARRNYVIKRLNYMGLLNSSDADRAKKEPVTLSNIDRKPSAMHFTDYVLGNIKKASSRNRGGELHTTIDESLNKNIESLLSSHIKKLQTGGITHGAVLVINNRSMEILSMVGSPDYWDGDKGSNNGTTMLRQPGSTLKPFTYAMAFSEGKSPAHVIPDIPINYGGKDSKLYEPQNYSGKFSGPVTLYEALGRSLNVPAIRLANAIGIDALLEQLHKFGFESLKKNTGHYGLGLTLGNGEVSLLELVRAYSIFPNKGYLRNINHISNSSANDENGGIQVLDEEIGFLITEILYDENLRMRAFGFDNPLLFEFPIAIKTGTSSNWKDNWVIGYTKDHTIGVWVGNFSGEPTNQYSGAIGAGPLFQQIGRLVHYSRKESDSPIWSHPSENVVKVEVCSVSGVIPNKHCTHKKQMHVLKVLMPKEKCDVHREVEIDIRNGMIASEKVAPQYRTRKVYEYLDPEYFTWMSQLNRQPPPEKVSPLNDNYNKFAVINPRDEEVYIYEPGYSEETQSIELRALVKVYTENLYWYVNDKILEPAKWPYKASLPMKPGTYAISFGTAKDRSEPVSITVK